MNFSKISNKGIMGKLLRLPLGLIPGGMVLPVLQGRLKGKRWVVGSGNHGCWIGTYELEKQILFAETIRKGSVVYDIGAHAGFYTLLASEAVGPAGKVISFEPQPRNLDFLNMHIRLNHCANVEVIEAAVGDHCGTAFFDGTNAYTGHISSKGRCEVKIIGLDEIVAKGELPPPDYMKIDVEGAELIVLSNSRSILIDYHPTIFLSTHETTIHQQCCSLLYSIGYEIRSINEKNINQTDELMAFKKSPAK